MGKDLIVFKEGLINKIKKFFINILNKKEQKSSFDEKVTQNITENKDNFKDNIIIRKNEEESKILNLQRNYKAGIILEENMSDEEHSKLVQLYRKQNDDLREKIETKKIFLRKRLNELKTE